MLVAVRCDYPFIEFVVWSTKYKMLVLWYPIYFLLFSYVILLSLLGRTIFQIGFVLFWIGD